MTTKFTAAFCWFLAGFVFVSAARGADLNQVASKIAGKPVTVQCEFNADSWQTLVRANFEPDPVSSDIVGFTNIEYPVVYLSPRICHAFSQWDTFGTDAGLVPFSLALLTLTHESVHQRGIRDESATSCTALTEVRSVAGLFGVPEKATTTKLVTAYKLVKGVKVRTLVARQAIVTNPVMTKLMAFIRAWHNSLPDHYRQGC